MERKTKLGKDDKVHCHRYRNSVPLDDRFGLDSKLIDETISPQVGCAHFCAHRTSKSVIIWCVRVANDNEEGSDKPNKGRHL